MLNVLQCPHCGQKLRIPDERIGKKLTCTACNKSFESSPYQVLSKTSNRDDEAKDEYQPFWLRLGKKAGADTTVMLDGTIGGAIGGLIVGVLVGGIAGAENHASNETVGGAVGGVLSGVFFGFIAGFVVGVVIGALIGASGKWVKFLFELKCNRASAISGIVAGSSVGGLLGASYYWVPVGAVLGGLGSYIWLRLNNWANDFMPPAPSSAILERENDDSNSYGRNRHDLQISAEEYQKRPRTFNPKSSYPT